MSLLSKIAVAASIADFSVKKFFFDLIKIDTVAATGSLISDAAVLHYGRNVVTAANGTKAVRLPKADPDSKVEIVNTSATQALIVFPELAADQINAITAGASLTMPGGSSAGFYCDTNGHWYAALATAATADTAELEYLNGALSTNLVAEKAAILGTGGALTLGGALTAVTSIGIGSAVLTEAEMEMLDTITAGTSAPSKALVLDDQESLVWATTDATQSETATLTIQDTRTGAGATGWAGKYELVSGVALGSYANALYGLVSLGTGGSCTGLVAGICGEVELSDAITSAGTYAAIEAELTANEAVGTGANTGFLYANIAGSNGTGKTTLNTNAHFAVLGDGVVNTADGLFDEVSSQVATATARLRIKVGAATWYIPLCANSALN